MSLAEDKQRAREGALTVRDKAYRQLGEAVAAALWSNLREAVAGAPAGAVVSGYWPMRREFDIRPAMARLHEAGFACALPVVTGPGRSLVFRRWRPGDPLVPGPFGTSQPEDDAPEATPSVVLAPLLAFDRSGRRLGYGGGYYDRTLRGLRARGTVTAIGVAFADQELAETPAGPDDERLDWIVTEGEAICVL